MKIQLGSIYTNKTKKYLLSTLIDYGETFEKKFTNLFKLALGIGDFALIDMGILIEHSIFILIDTKFSRRNFNATIQWMRHQPYYEFDYPFDDIHKGHLHMIVIKVPEKFKETYEFFQISSYSKMYDSEVASELFSSRPEELNVLLKNPNLVEPFVEKINKMFKTNVGHNDWTGELDLPLKDEEEYFNLKLFINSKKKTKYD